MPHIALVTQKLTLSRARHEFDSLLNHRSTRLALRATFLLLGVSWLVLVWFWGKLPPVVPLLYSRPWGEEQVVPVPFIVLLPGLSTLFSLINLRLASLFFAKETFFSQFLVWLNLTVVLLATTTLVRILLIVT